MWRRQDSGTLSNVCSSKSLSIGNTTLPNTGLCGIGIGEHQILTVNRTDLLIVWD